MSYDYDDNNNNNHFCLIYIYIYIYSIHTNVFFSAPRPKVCANNSRPRTEATK